MNTVLLDALLKHLEFIPENRFDLWEWKSECGSTACAIGHGADCLALKEAGLQLRQVDVEPNLQKLNGAKRWSPYCEGFTDLQAVSHLFKITGHQAYFLFHPMSYPSNARNNIRWVISRVRVFIETKGENYQLWRRTTQSF